MEAASQQNLYNKTAMVVISSKLSFGSIHFQDLVQKITKWLIIIHYFRFMMFFAFTLSNSNLAHFIIKFTGTCVQDMESGPTHAVESSEIRLVPGFKHISRPCNLFAYCNMIYLILLW